MRVLAIDPGDTMSAYTLIDADTCKPLAFDKVTNWYLRAILDQRICEDGIDILAVEKVESYGMSVGANVFATCVWAGRFLELAHGRTPETSLMIGRAAVKLHHCGQRKAKDGNIIQALVDRFAPDTPNRGKGHKAAPGWFYGFRVDVWQAYALAVLVADEKCGRSGVA